MTAALTSTRSTRAEVVLPRKRERGIGGRVWDALVQVGERRTHREIAYLLRSRGIRVTGDLHRDLERFVSVYAPSWQNAVPSRADHRR